MPPGGIERRLLGARCGALLWRELDACIRRSDDGTGGKGRVMGVLDDDFKGEHLRIVPAPPKTLANHFFFIRAYVFPSHSFSPALSTSTYIGTTASEDERNHDHRLCPHGDSTLCEGREHGPAEASGSSGGALQVRARIDLAVAYHRQRRWCRRRGLGRGFGHLRGCLRRGDGGAFSAARRVAGHRLVYV